MNQLNKNNIVIAVYFEAQLISGSSRLTMFLHLFPLSVFSSAAVCTWVQTDSRAQQERRVSGVWLTGQWWAHRERVKGEGQRSGSHGEGGQQSWGNREGGLANKLGWLIALHARKRDGKPHGNIYDETLLILIRVTCIINTYKCINKNITT